MKKRRVFKYILLTILLVVAGMAALFAYQIYDRLCWFGLEDRVVHSYEGVVGAIEEYVRVNQEAPQTLSFVSSGVMSEINAIGEIVRTDYYVIPERQAWKLDVLVRARGKERQFVYVSDGQLTPQEEARYYVWCHDWIVLRVP